LGFLYKQNILIFLIEIMDKRKNININCIDHDNVDYIKGTNSFLTWPIQEIIHSLKKIYLKCHKYTSWTKYEMQNIHIFLINIEYNLHTKITQFCGR
jgi:hypothetical protein